MRGRSARREPKCNDWGNVSGHYRRFRIPHLRSMARLAAWQGHGAQAITHLREAAELAYRDRLTRRTVADPGEVGKDV